MLIVERGRTSKKSDWEERMSVEENKALVRRFYDEFVNGNNPAVAEELIATECSLYMGGNLMGTGPEGYRRTLAMLRSGFPDLHTTIEDVIAEGDKVAERVTTSGTHRGEFMGVAPTGKRISMVGISIFKISEGKVAENRAVPDMLGLMQQIGAVTEPGEHGVEPSR